MHGAGENQSCSLRSCIQLSCSKGNSWRASARILRGCVAFLVNPCVHHDSFGKHLERGGHYDYDPDFLYDVLTVFANDTRTGPMDEELPSQGMEGARYTEGCWDVPPLGASGFSHHGCTDAKMITRGRQRTRFREEQRFRGRILIMAAKNTTTDFNIKSLASHTA